MSEDKKPFTVKDRRHFTAEGAARDAAPEADPVAEPEGTATPREPPPNPTRVAETPAEASEPPRAEHTGGRFPSDFASLLVTLGTQGSMLLAGIVPGAEEAGPPDLDGAKDVISLLESLKTRTEGRLTAEEDRLLSGILYELRMGYVALRKGTRA
jgi:hypothetical protein